MKIDLGDWRLPGNAASHGDTPLAIEARGLAKQFDGAKAVDGIDIQVRQGEIYGILGPNGAGKTTLIAQLSGLLKPDAGRISFDGRDITGAAPYTISSLGLARSFQVTSIFLNFTAEDNVALAVQAHSGHSFRFWRRAQSDPALRKPAREALERVGLDHRADTIAADLSHGEQRQLEIAMAIATKPSMLLLDEPMAGMNLEEKEDIARFIIDIFEGQGVTYPDTPVLRDGVSCIILVEHDMGVVMDIADRIVVLDFGRKIAEGTPEEIKNNQQVIGAYLGEEKK